MCEPKCVCGKCLYCLEHSRYLREKSLRLVRGRVKNLQIKYIKEESNRLLDDFIDRKISLRELEVELDAR